MCARWLLIHNSPKYSKRYSEAAYKLKQKIEQTENNNEKDIKEKENMRDYSYFTTILNNINYKDITNYEEHQRYLLLSVLILQPTVRTSYYTSCKIIRSKKENDKINNFLLFQSVEKIQQNILLIRIKQVTTKIII